MPQLDLTPDQHSDAVHLREHLATALAADIAGLADLLATTTDRELFGVSEFQVHTIGAKALRAAADRQSSPLRRVQPKWTGPTGNSVFPWLATIMPMIGRHIRIAD